jgi:hypothetical protein
MCAQLGLVVQEKELGLRQALCNMGMTDLSYWVSWQAWDITMAFITSHLICIFGGGRCCALAERVQSSMLWLSSLLHLPARAAAERGRICDRNCVCGQSWLPSLACQMAAPACHPLHCVCYPLQPALPLQLTCCCPPRTGLILQFDLFKKNDYGILFFLFFLFQMAMNSMAYVLSTVIRKSQTGVYTGFLIFLVGWICQVGGALV